MPIWRPRDGFSMIPVNGWTGLSGTVFIVGGQYIQEEYGTTATPPSFAKVPIDDKVYGFIRTTASIGPRVVEYSYPSLPHSGTAVAQGKLGDRSIFVFGGATTASGTTRDARRIDATSTGTSNSGTGLNTLRAGANVVCFRYVDSGSVARDGFFVWSGNTASIDRYVYISGGVNTCTTIVPPVSNVSGAAHEAPDQSYVLFTGGVVKDGLSPGTIKVSGTNSVVTQLTGSGAPTVVSRSNFASAIDYIGRLWVVGGLSGTTVLSSSEVYSFTAQTWSAGPSLPTASSYGVLIPASGSDRLVYVGGNSGTQLHSGWTLSASNTGAGWSAFTSLYTPRTNARAVQLDDGRIFIHGGQYVSASVRPIHQLAAEEISRSGSANLTWSYAYTTQYYQLSVDYDGGGGPVTYPWDHVILTNSGWSSQRSWPPALWTFTRLSRSGGTGTFDALANIFTGTVPMNFSSSANLYVLQFPQYSVMNNTTMSFRGGGMTSSYTSTLNYLQPVVNSITTTASLPGSGSNTASGYRLDYPLTVSFYNDSVYGAGVRFTGTIAASSAFTNTFVPPGPLATTTATGSTIYLRSNVQHNISVLYRSGSATGTYLYSAAGNYWSSSFSSTLSRFIDNFVVATWSLGQSSTSTTGGLYVSSTFSASMASTVSGRTSVAGQVGNALQNNAGATTDTAIIVLNTYTPLYQQLWTNSLTVEFWYKGALGTDQTIMAAMKTGSYSYPVLTSATNDDNGAQNTLFKLGVTSGSSRYVYLDWEYGYRGSDFDGIDSYFQFSPDTWRIGFNGYTLPQDGNWHHVAIVRSTGSGALYVDSVHRQSVAAFRSFIETYWGGTGGGYGSEYSSASLIGEGAWASEFAQAGRSGTLFLGSCVTVTATFDEISISRTARTVAEIQRSYLQNSGGFYQ